VALEIPMLDLVRLHEPLAEELEQAFAETLRSGRFIGGEAVERFEEELARHVGTYHAVGVSSGTDALLATLMAHGVGPGDEVITTPYTFFATAGAVARLGARPVFVDIDSETFNIDPRAIPGAVTERTVGIIPVHLFGQCAEMDPILAVAQERGLWVVEDAAQAIGARWGDRSAGTMGAAGAFSFFPAKNLGALGDGGAVVTDDSELADTLRALRQHGARAKYHHEMVGGNFRLDALQAALLAVKLPHLAGWETGRQRVAGCYREALAGVEGLVLPGESPNRRHVYNQFVVRVRRKRDALLEALGQAGIGCAVYYPEPLHLLPCFTDLGYGPGTFPAAEGAARETLALPVDPLLGDSEIEQICRIIKETIE